MSDIDTLVPNTDSLASQEHKQRRMMVAALALLLFALGFVLYRDRGFWFLDIHRAEGQPEQATAASSATTRPLRVEKKRHNSKSQPKDSASVAVAPPGMAATERTVLAPLEVEVIAGKGFHRIVHPSTKSIRVNLQPNSHPQAVSDPSTTSGVAAETAASVTSNSAEDVQMSADTAEIVGRPVKPDYPLLAREMKVTGSVVLQALISREGTIQALDVVSGPPILADAAKEAVKQWHFKPHYQGADAVETKAKITVNFTISTN